METISYYAIPLIPKRWRNGYKKNLPEPKIKPEDILQLVSEETGVSIEIIKGKRRFPYIVQARHLYCLFAKMYTYLNLGQIGRPINYKEHTAIRHAVTTAKNLIETDENFAAIAKNIETKLNELDAS